MLSKLVVPLSKIPLVPLSKMPLVHRGMIKLPFLFFFHWRSSLLFALLTVFPPITSPVNHCCLSHSSLVDHHCLPLASPINRCCPLLASLTSRHCIRRRLSSSLSPVDRYCPSLVSLASRYRTHHCPSISRCLLEAVARYLSSPSSPPSLLTSQVIFIIGKGIFLELYFNLFPLIRLK